METDYGKYELSGSEKKRFYAAAYAAVFAVCMVYLYSADNITDLISFDIDYDVRIRLPLRIRDGNEHSTSIICRGFTGAGPQNRPMSFAAMEHDPGRLPPGHPLPHVRSRIGQWRRSMPHSQIWRRGK